MTCQILANIGKSLFNVGCDWEDFSSFGFSEWVLSDG